MSAESLRNRLLLRALAGKCLSDGFGGVAELLNAAQRTFEWFSDTAHAVEHDAAIRYQELTGVDLGAVMEEPDRYADERERGIETSSEDGDLL